MAQLEVISGMMRSETRKEEVDGGEGAAVRGGLHRTSKSVFADEIKEGSNQI